MHIIKGVEIAGISTKYPSRIERTDDYAHFSQEESEKFKKNVGISERRIVDEKTCASDLCESACRDLLSDLNWAGDDVDVLIMITQTGDYPVPATSIVLQNKLGIKKSSVCFDVNLGCSSFPYGLFIISSLMQASTMQRGILLIGDVSSKVCSYEDKSSFPLFGDAGCAIAFQKSTGESKFTFDLMTDGEGAEAIIINTGGLASRNPISQESLQMRQIGEGIKRNDLNLILKGADIFSFAISKIPKSLKLVAENSLHDINNFDFIVLHQANKMINQQIIRKVSFDPERSLESLELYGNTSSVSIPLTITYNKNKMKNQRKKIIASGFGVGLSWGTVAFELNENVKLLHSEYK